jgi:spore coat polysaccharide biosynthesis protein SpsF
MNPIPREDSPYLQIIQLPHMSMKKHRLNTGFGVLLQARSGATRLPQKMTLPFFEGHGILEIVIQTALQAFDQEHVILATTDSNPDDELASIASSFGVQVFRGSEHDVLQRFIDCAHQFNLNHVVRICADNPFLRADFLQELVKDYERQPADYVSYAFPDQTPIIRSHIGLFAEVVSVAALEKASLLTTEAFYHEHVTNFIYGNPQQFDVRFLSLPELVRSRNDIRLTVDTIDDFEMASQLFAELHGKGNTLEALLQLLDEKPDMLERMGKLINTYVK